MAHTTYDLIKKNNGEHFARALRDANLLEMPNIVERVKYAGRDAKPELIQYLLAEKANRDLADAYAIDGADPFELLHRAGYSLVEYADTLEKQNAIRKYFAKDEDLCTFRDPNRHQNYYIINAVHRDVDKIKRSPKPERQDAYGTSVISIQIRKTGGFISIKNRYNHTVANPDNTFNSNPDNIIPGLTMALKAYFNVEFDNSRVPLPDGMTRIGDHIIKYNYEIDNVYIGDFFWESHGQIHEIDRSTQIMMDYFYFDIKQNDVFPIVLGYDEEDCFADVLNAEIAGRHVTVRGKYPNQSLWVGDVCLVELDGPSLKSINLPNRTIIGNKFLWHNKKLISLQVPNLEYVGDFFLRRNAALVHLLTPKLKTVRDSFLEFNIDLSDLCLPELETTGSKFLNTNAMIESLSLPNLTNADNYFISRNTGIKHLSAPKLREVGHYFLSKNLGLSKLSLPSLTHAGDNFIASNEVLTSVDLPNLVDVGACFLYNNTALKSLAMPKLQYTGNAFLRKNEIIEFLDMPDLYVVGNTFLCNNLKLKHLSLPNLSKVGTDFLYSNTQLNSLDVANLEFVDQCFCKCNTRLKHLNFPKLQVVESDFLRDNKKLETLIAPRLNKLCGSFLFKNMVLKTLQLGNNVSLKQLRITSLHIQKMLNDIIAQSPKNIPSSMSQIMPNPWRERGA